MYCVSQIQSIIWGVLSLLAILCVYGIIKVDLYNPDAMPNVFTRWLYMMYLSGESQQNMPAHARVFPNEFFVYVFWPIFLFSVFLAFCSAAQLVLLAQDVKRTKLRASATVLVVLTFLSCVYDLAAMVVFVIDYVNIRNFLEIVAESIEVEYLLTVPLVMATLAAKGYVLWVFNFAMAVSVSVMLNKKESSPEPDEHVFSRTNSAYNAFGDSGLSNGMEEPANVRRPTQFHRRETQTNPDAQIDDDGHSTTTSWAEMPRSTIYQEPFDSIAPQSTARFAPPSQWFDSTPNLNMLEPEPDYSPEPTRRFGMNHPTETSADNIYATR
ncbi:hypothetical protein CBL_11135 [Carabus blaptoides fortunei]